MRYDAVLFDLDGTLTASARGIFNAVCYAVDQMGAQRPDEKTMRSFVGPSMYDSMRNHFGFDDANARKALALYRDHYVENGLFDAEVFAGIPHLLRQLREAGVYVALATSKPASSARVVLEHFGLTRFFAQIIGADAERTETNKRSLVEAALPARYTRAAMVGDRRFDMEAAKSLGIDAIGAGWGYGTDDELRDAGADVICGTVQDAAQALLGKRAFTPKGFFLSVEGLDGSGKTTQMNAMADYIRARGYDVVTTREPGGTPVSEEVRHLVLDPQREVSAETEALLYAAARAQHVKDVINPAVAAGKVVLCDRFVDSSVAYQGAGRELGIDQVRAINAFAIKGAMPDMTLLLVVDAQTAFLRRHSATPLDRLERAGEAFFGRVYDAYAKLAAAEPDRIRCVDAQRPIEAVTADACQQVDRMLALR